MFGKKDELNKLMRSFVSVYIYSSVGFCNSFSVCAYWTFTSRATYVHSTYTRTGEGSTHPLPRYDGITIDLSDDGKED